MSTTLNDAPPVVGEQLANDRLDALIAEHNLPDPVTRTWCDHGQQYKSLAGHYDMFVHLATEAEITRWAAALGVPAVIKFDGRDSTSDRWAAGTWSITRCFTVEVRDWLGPHADLVVTVSEHRMILPAGAR